MTATTIPEAIAALESIIEWSKQHNSRIGYFATLYKRMTEAVKSVEFQDSKRMERLAVTFANRYLTAWECHTRDKPCCEAWKVVFDACNNPRLIVLQHLLLGINTHINLDLAIAAAETCPGNEIYDLKADFEKINEVIISLFDDVQLALTKVWWPLRLFSQVKYKPVLEFSFEKARQAAWSNAKFLAELSSHEGKHRYIKFMSIATIDISNRIINPGFVRYALWPVRTMESKSVAKNIELLQSN
jgi:Family of unknown function (DUF5995)